MVLEGTVCSVDTANLRANYRRFGAVEVVVHVPDELLHDSKTDCPFVGPALDSMVFKTLYKCYNAYFMPFYFRNTLTPIGFFSLAQNTRSSTSFAPS